MASTIQIKRGTGASTPSTLAAGELAINTDNGSLYFGTTGGTSVSSSFTFTEITSSGNISSSGDLIATDITASGLLLTGLISSSNTGNHLFGGDIVLDNQVFFAGKTAGGLNRVMLGINATDQVQVGGTTYETKVQGTTVELSGSTGLTTKGNLTFHSSMTASSTDMSISGSNILCNLLIADNNATFNDVVTIANNIKVQGVSGVGGSAKGLIQLAADDTVVLASDNNDTRVQGDVSMPTRLLMSSSATDGDYHGDIVKFGAQTITTVGRIYRWNGAGGWSLARANSAANAQGLLAVALGASSTNNGMLIRGFVTLDHDPGASGDELYLSDSATQGLATNSQPTSDGDIIRKIGVCMHDTSGAIYFDPSPDFFEHV